VIGHHKVSKSRRNGGFTVLQVFRIF
jgi:hypothetical protein